MRAVGRRGTTSVWPCTTGEVGAPYAWKEYRPSLNYNFRKLYPDFQAPAKDLEEFPVAGRISEGWWTYAWGPKANHLATDKVGAGGHPQHAGPDE